MASEYFGAYDVVIRFEGESKPMSKKNPLQHFEFQNLKKSKIKIMHIQQKWRDYYLSKFIANS